MYDSCFHLQSTANGRNGQNGQNAKSRAEGAHANALAPAKGHFTAARTVLERKFKLRSATLRTVQVRLFSSVK